MSNKLSSMSPAEVAEFKTLEKEAIEFGIKIRDNSREFLVRIKTIEKRELWRANYKTKQEFVAALGEAIGRSGRTIFRMLEGEEIRFQLAKKLYCQSDSKNAKSLVKVVDSMTTQALLEVAKASPEHRLTVVEEASKQIGEKGAPTAPAIAAAAKVKSQDRKASDKSTWPHDDTPNGGHPIPPPAWSFWERRDEVQEDLNQISAMKVRIQKAKASGDSLYSWIGTPAIDALQNAYTTISNAKLYAVCTKCEGWWDKMSGGGCSTCHNTGLLSKHQYEVCSPKEIKAIREKGNRATA